MSKTNNKRKATKKEILLACSPGLLIMLYWLIGHVGFGLQLNTSSSLPSGIWQRSDESIQQAHYVSFCLHHPHYVALAQQREYFGHGDCPGDQPALLKPIVARQGDTVIVSEQGLWVNDQQILTHAIRTQDSQGRPLQPVAPGVYPVEPNQLWVISTYSPHSFDSRFFGPIHIDHIHHTMRPLWVNNQRPDFTLHY